MAVPLGVGYSVGLDKRIMSRVRRYSVIQSPFAALKFPCALPLGPYFLSNAQQPLIFLMSP